MRAGVRRDSAGKQVPWEVTSLEGNLYFYPPPAPAVVTTIPSIKPPSSTVTMALPPPPVPSPPTGALATVPPAVASTLAVTANSTLSAPARPSKPPPAQNPLGYTTGDKWNYQVVDGYRNEVVRNYRMGVGRILPNGGFLSPGGDAEYDQNGGIIKWTNPAGERRELAPNGPRWWPNMKVGDKRSLKYESITVIQAGNVVNVFDLDGKVVGIETIKVPAGEFKAYRIEYSGNSTAIGRPGAGRLSLTIWYDPEIHTMVALETASVWNGRPDAREREELTSYSLVNVPAGR